MSAPSAGAPIMELVYELETRLQRTFSDYLEVERAIEQVRSAAHSRALLAGSLLRHYTGPGRAVKEAHLELYRRLGQEIATACLELTSHQDRTAGEVAQHAWALCDTLEKMLQTRRLEAEEAAEAVPLEDPAWTQVERARLLHFGALEAAEPLTRALANLILESAEAPDPDQPSAVS